MYETRSRSSSQQTVEMVVVADDGDSGNEGTGGTSCSPPSGWVPILEPALVQGLPRD